MLEPCEVSDSSKRGNRKVVSGSVRRGRCGFMSVDPYLLTGRLSKAWHTVVWAAGWDRSEPENNPGFLRAYLGSVL